MAIATLATRQHGVVEHSQLLELGLTERMIQGRIRAGRLHRLHRGVYAVGHRRVSREGRWLAAVLASGDGAVLSHCAAADLWELRASKEIRIDVIAMSHRAGGRGVRIHSHELSPGESTTRHAIPVTTPLRTLLDLAAVIPQRELERAVRQAVYRKLTTTTLLGDAVRKRAGQRGTGRLKQTLVHLGESPGLQRSDLEQDFLTFLRRYRLPQPDELNAELRIAGRRIEADCVWHEQRLIVELDGRDAHDSTPAFESDRARDLALLAHGWRTARVTTRRMRHDGRALARELRVLTR